MSREIKIAVVKLVTKATVPDDVDDEEFDNQMDLDFDYVRTAWEAAAESIDLNLNQYLGLTTKTEVVE